VAQKRFGHDSDGAVKTRDLALGLKRLGEDEFAEESPVVAIGEDGRTYSVASFELEIHEDTQSSTVWLHIEET
jgi:hypothetical protein